MTAKTLFVNDKALRISELMYNYSSTIWIRKNNVMHVEFYTLDALSREYCITLNTQDPCKSKGFICILSLPIAFLSFNK